jgi:hypothetical protein
MRRIFWGFCRNLFLMSPLHYLSSRSDFGFDFAEIFVFEKRPPLSPILGVADSSYQWYGESPTSRITDTRSQRLPASLIRGVGDSPHHRNRESALEFFKRKLSVSMIWRVVDSPHQWYGESPTPHIVESESRRLRVSLLRRVDYSANRWYGETLFKEKINLVSIFRAFNG